MISSQLYCVDSVCPPPSALMVHCQIKCEDLHYHATYWPLSSGAQLCNSDQRIIFTADWPVEIKLGWEFSVTRTDTEEVRGHQGKCELRNVLLTEVLQNDRLKILKGINPGWSDFCFPQNATVSVADIYIFLRPCLSQAIRLSRMLRTCLCFLLTADEGPLFARLLGPRGCLRLNAVAAGKGQGKRWLDINALLLQLSTCWLEMGRDTCTHGRTSSGSDSCCRHVMNKITRGCLSFFLLNETLSSQTNRTLLTPVSLSGAHLGVKCCFTKAHATLRHLKTIYEVPTKSSLMWVCRIYNLLRTQTGEQRNMMPLTQSCPPVSTTRLFILSDSVTTLRTTSCQAKWQF